MTLQKAAKKAMKQKTLVALVTLTTARLMKGGLIGAKADHYWRELERTASLVGFDLDDFNPCEILDEVNNQNRMELASGEKAEGSGWEADTLIYF